MMDKRTAEIIAHASASLSRADELHTDIAARRRPTRLLMTIGIMYYDLYVMRERLKELSGALADARADERRAQTAAMFYGWQVETLVEAVGEYGVIVERPEPS